MTATANMNSATCNVIYVDRNVRDDTRLSTSSTTSDVNAALGESTELRANLAMLLEAFGDVHVCATGAACISKLLSLHDASAIELKPTIVMIDMPHDEQPLDSLPASPTRSTPSRDSDNEGSQNQCFDEELYGLRLLDRIVYETHSRNLAKLVVPIPIVASPLLQSPSVEDLSRGHGKNASTSYATYEEVNGSLMNRRLLRKCLDSGAVDVMASPLHMKTLTTLEVHAYRAHKEAVREQAAMLEIKKGRKRSWVGIREEKPYSYLREAMVSNLMKGICRWDEEGNTDPGSVRICVSPERRAAAANAVGDWHFSAHSLCDDQLVVAATLMFKHAFTMPELEHWRIPTDQLTAFLVACRAAYNTFVPYHNFRHAVDVLQATFDFLVKIGALPPYPGRRGASVPPTEKSPIAELLKPFEALTLLISAIGHDVGHPGVNNGFLVMLNAPLAQLYNDRSVLESFHCAAFSQILRRYWPKAFEDTKMRSLMISSILATDMHIHFDYMTKLGSLQERLHERNSTDGWNGRTLESETALACALLIKCADISNVARSFDVAVEWMNILCDEFSRQASMEEELGIPSSLVSEPKKDFLLLAKSQLGFMNMFALPLFQGVADIIPAMQYTVDELEINKISFEKAIEGHPQTEEERRQRLLDGTLSPRSLSLARTPPGDAKDSSCGETLPLPENHAEMKAAGSSSPGQSPRIPNTPGSYKEVNGTAVSFESLNTDFAVCDPFDINDGEDSMRRHNAKQRSSETTEGSSSVPCSGDWGSQATSATTGKIPVSPSTQGTSIISTDDAYSERPSSRPGPGQSYDANHLIPPMPPPLEPVSSGDEHSNGNSPEGDKSLARKPSRLRMTAMSLFRRVTSGRSPSPAGRDCDG